LKVLEKENSLESRMAFSRNQAIKMKTEYPFFRGVINPLSMLNNSSEQRLIPEATLKELNRAFISSYGQMQEGEFRDELKQQLNDALEGLARGDETAADAVQTLNAKTKEGLFLKKAKNILMPTEGGLRKRKTRGRRLAKRKIRRLAKKTRRS
jgi:hypothetical protein